MRDFITYFLKNAGELSELVGYVGLPQEDYISQLALIK
jgi:hypothetical protein